MSFERQCIREYSKTLHGSTIFEEYSKSNPSRLDDFPRMPEIHIQNFRKPLVSQKLR